MLAGDKSKNDGACVALVGIGGIGAEVMKKLIATKTLHGRRVTTVVAVDYFPPGSARRDEIRDALAAAFPRVIVLHWDATNFETTLAVDRQLAEALGGTKVDALILTTGMGYHGALHATPLELTHKALEKLMHVNCTGPSLLVTAFAKNHMRGAPSKGSAGSSSSRPPVILIMSSYSGLVGLPFRAAYCSSKFALNGFVEGLYADMPHLRVVLTCPITVDTAFRDNWRKQIESGGGAAAKAAPKAKLAKEGGSALSVEECVASVWQALDDRHAGPGLRYQILKGWKAQLAYVWLRFPGFRDYSRRRLLLQGSKL